MDTKFKNYKFDFNIRLKKFITKIINQRKEIIRLNKSKKNEALMRKYITYLENNNIDFSIIGAAKFMLTNKNIIRSIIVDYKETKIHKEFVDLLSEAIKISNNVDSKLIETLNYILSSLKYFILTNVNITILEKTNENLFLSLLYEKNKFININIHHDYLTYKINDYDEQIIKLNESEELSNFIILLNKF